MMYEPFLKFTSESCKGLAMPFPRIMLLFVAATVALAPMCRRYLPSSGEQLLLVYGSVLKLSMLSEGIEYLETQ
jgi:hypothetical protein